MDLMALSARISLDASQLEQGLRQAEDSMRRAANNFGGYGEQIEQASKKFFSGIAKGAVEQIGRKLTDFIMSIPGRIKDAFKHAIELAGELEQNIGGSHAVFGEYFDELQTVAKRAYREVGLSQSKYLQEANKMGSLLQGMGYSQKESMEMTVDVMRRASDVASIMGIDVSSAMAAIEGAAKGNFTMMDNLGVAINETTLQAYAAQKGMDKNAIKSMNTQQKVALAFDLFMEKTSQYAGNYAKENDTLAGSVNTFKMAWEDFLSGVGDGEAVVNAGEDALKAIWRTAMDLAPKLWKGIQTIVKKGWPKIKKFAKGAANDLIHLFNETFGTNIPDIEVIISWIQEKWADVQAAFDTVKGWVDGVNITIKWFQDGWTHIKLAFDITGLWAEHTFNVTINWISVTWASIQNAFNTAGEWVGKSFQVTVNWVRGTWVSIQNAFNTAGKWVDKTFEVTINWVRGTWVSVQNAFNTAGGWVNKTFNVTINWVRSAWASIQSAFNAASEWADKTFQVTINWVRGTWSTIQNAFNVASQWADKTFNVTINWVRGTWATVRSAFEATGEWANKTFNTTINWVRGTWASVQNAFSVAGRWADKTFQVTIDWVRGTWASVQNAFDTAGKWADKTFNTTINWVRGTWASVQNTFDTASEWVDKRKRVVINWAQERWQLLSSRLAEVNEWISNKINSIKITWESIVDGWITTIDGWLSGTGIKDFTLNISSIVDGWIKTIADWIENGINVTVDFFGNLFNGGAGGSSTHEGDFPHSGGGHGFAKGLNYVPYDGFLAELHRGEQVLTASQARHRNEGEGTGGLAAMVGELKSTLTHLRIQVGEKEFGSTVADYGSSRVRKNINGFNRKRRMGYGSI